MSKPINLGFHGELMNNYANQIPIEAGKEFKSLTNNKNQPIIFSIGSDNKLRLICQSENESAPWKLIDLGTKNVTHFAVAQNPINGEIRVAYSTFLDGKAKLYFSSLQDNDSTKFKSASNFQWNEHQLSYTGSEISKIEINFEYLMYATKDNDHQAFYYTAKFGEENKKYELPEFGSEILDFKVGSYANKYGVYLLYNIGSGQRLLFNYFDDDKLPKTFSPKGKVNSIDLIRKKDGKDNLIACGESVYLYETDKKGQSLIEKRGTEFSDIKACNSDYSSLWIIEKEKNQKTTLLFMTDYFFDEPQQKFIRKWTSDIPFAKGIRQFSCIKGHPKGNNLMVLDENNQLSHIFQDPKTTMWKENSISIEALDEILEFSCYTSCITLRDEESNLPAINTECYVSASSETSVMINGISYKLNPENPVLLKSDIMGNITIISSVEEDLTTPIFYIGYSENSPKYILDPSHKIDERLSKIKNAKDFKKAKTCDGDSLWIDDDIPKDKDLNSSALIIQQILSTKKDLLDEKKYNLPDSAPIPEDFRPDSIWGAKFDGDDISYLNENEAESLLDDQEKNKSWNPFKWVGHAIGTIFRSIKSLFTKLKSFVVKTINKVTTFVLEIAGKVFEFVIDTLETVFPFLKTIFDIIGLVFKTLLKWLGKIFGWNDIWDTHKVIAKITTNGTQSISKQVDKSVDIWKDSIDDFVNSLENKMHEVTQSDMPQDVDKSDNKTLNTFMHLFGSPLFNWPMYHLLHSGALKKVYNFLFKDNPLLNSFIEKQAKIYEELGELIEKQINSILEFATKPSFSPKSLLKLFEPIIEFVLDKFNDLLKGILDFLSESIKTAQEFFTETIEIPFFTPMYKFITDLLGEKEEFSLVNVFSLIVAIPYTIFYKIFTGGEKPFEKVPSNFWESEMFDSLFENGFPNPKLQIVNSSFMLSNSKEMNDWDQIATIYQGYGGFIGAFTGMFNGFFSFGKGEKLIEEISQVLSIISFATTIPIAKTNSLNTKGKITALTLREFQYIIGLVMAFVIPNVKRYTADKNPKEKAIVNEVLSAVCLGTNITSNILSNPGTLGWIGQMFSRTSSLVSGAGVIADKNPYVILAGGSLGLIGGVMSISNAAISLEEDIQLYHGTFV